MRCYCCVARRSGSSRINRISRTPLPRPAVGFLFLPNRDFIAITKEDHAQRSLEEIPSVSAREIAGSALAEPRADPGAALVQRGTPSGRQLGAGGAHEREPEARIISDALVQSGFKEIEGAFPSASNTEFAFNRRLIEEQRAPEDVWLQVLVQAREDLIERTFQISGGSAQGHHPPLQFHVAGPAPDRLRHVAGRRSLAVAVVRL